MIKITSQDSDNGVRLLCSTTDRELQTEMNTRNWCDGSPIHQRPVTVDSTSNEESANMNVGPTTNFTTSFIKLSSQLEMMKPKGIDSANAGVHHEGVKFSTDDRLEELHNGESVDNFMKTSDGGPSDGEICTQYHHDQAPISQALEADKNNINEVNCNMNIESSTMFTPIITLSSQLKINATETITPRVGDNYINCEVTSAANAEGCNLVVSCESWEEAKAFIRMYEVQTDTKFAIYRKHLAFNKPGKIDISKHKIQFEDIKESGKEQCIKYTGIPFIVLGATYLDCIYGVDRNVTTKKKRFDKEEEVRRQIVKETGDPSLAKKRRAVRTKKIGCPASIAVRDIIFFPQYIASRNTRFFRNERSKGLRDAYFNNSDSVVTERKFYIKLPDLEFHLGHPVGNSIDLVHLKDSVGNLSGTEHETPLIPKPHNAGQTCYRSIDASPQLKADVANGTLVKSATMSIQAPGNEDILETQDEYERNNAHTEIDEEDLNLALNGTENSESVEGTNIFTIQGLVDQELAPPISSKISPAIQMVWDNGLETEKFDECLKRIKTPENCKLFVAPTLNPNIQCELTDPVKERDERSFMQQNLVVKAATPLMQMLDILHNLEEGSFTTDHIENLKQYVEDSFICLSHLNADLLNARKDDILNNFSGENRNCKCIHQPENLFTGATDRNMLSVEPIKSCKHNCKARSWTGYHSSSSHISQDTKHSGKAKERE